MTIGWPPRLHPARARLANGSARSRTRSIWNGFFGNPSKRENPVLRSDIRSAVGAPEEPERHFDDLTLRFVETMVQALDARDPYTAGHSHRVSATSTAIAERMRLPRKQIEVIRIGSLLHDIGKIGVPDAILQKPGKLSRDEYAAIQQHTAIGKKILERVGQFQKFLPFAELHHENYGGNGYPHGLKGEEIPLPVRIVHVADVYDALRSNRAYRAAMAENDIREMMIRGSGKLFDPAVVEVFLAVVRERRAIDGTFRIEGVAAAIA
jgi:putative nucleotidyltransferase with HDIG domain